MRYRKNKLIKLTLRLRTHVCNKAIKQMIKKTTRINFHFGTLEVPMKEKNKTPNLHDALVGTPFENIKFKEIPFDDKLDHPFASGYLYIPKDFADTLDVGSYGCVDKFGRALLFMKYEYKNHQTPVQHNLMQKLHRLFYRLFYDPVKPVKHGYVSIFQRRQGVKDTWCRDINSQEGHLLQGSNPYLTNEEIDKVVNFLT